MIRFLTVDITLTVINRKEYVSTFFSTMDHQFHKQKIIGDCWHDNNTVGSVSVVVVSVMLLLLLLLIARRVRDYKFSSTWPSESCELFYIRGEHGCHSHYRA